MKKKHKKILALTMLTSMFALTSGYFYINDNYKKASADSTIPYTITTTTESRIQSSSTTGLEINGNTYTTITQNVYGTKWQESMVGDKEITISMSESKNTTSLVSTNDILIPTNINNKYHEVSKITTYQIQNTYGMANTTVTIPINYSFSTINNYQPTRIIYSRLIYTIYTEDGNWEEYPISGEYLQVGIKEAINQYRTFTRWKLAEEIHTNFTYNNQTNKYEYIENKQLTYNPQSSWIEVAILEYITQENNNSYNLVKVNSTHSTQATGWTTLTSTGIMIIRDGSNPIEVIDLGGLMWQILTMPFAFISVAFDVTLFPNTAFSVDIGQLFLGLLAIIIFITLMKLIIKMTMGK